MTREFGDRRNRVEQSTSGAFNAIWRGQVIYENGRVKKFETADDARDISIVAIVLAESFIEVEANGGPESTTCGATFGTTHVSQDLRGGIAARQNLLLASTARGSQTIMSGRQ